VCCASPSAGLTSLDRKRYRLPAAMNGAVVVLLVALISEVAGASPLVRRSAQDTEAQDRVGAINSADLQHTAPSFIQQQSGHESHHRYHHRHHQQGRWKRVRGNCGFSALSVRKVGQKHHVTLHGDTDSHIVCKFWPVCAHSKNLFFSMGHGFATFVQWNQHRVCTFHRPTEPAMALPFVRAGGCSSFPFSEFVGGCRGMKLDVEVIEHGKRGKELVVTQCTASNDGEVEKGMSSCLEHGGHWLCHHKEGHQGWKFFLFPRVAIIEYHEGKVCGFQK